MSIATNIIAKRGPAMIASAVAAIFAGGLTTIAILQPAVEKAADYGAKAVELYCKLPTVDRERFRSEIAERLVKLAEETGSSVADVRVTCPLDTRRE